MAEMTNSDETKVRGKKEEKKKKGLQPCLPKA